MTKVFKAEWTNEMVELDTSNLTEMESSVMIAGRNNEFEDAFVEGSTWSNVVADNSVGAKSYRGVVSSLIKKGYVEIKGYKNNETFSYTESGKKLFKVIGG